MTTEETRAARMQALIEHVLANQPEGVLIQGHAAGAQVAFVNGQQTAGMLKKGPVEGTYSITTALLDGRGTPRGVAEMFFTPDVVFSVSLMIDTEGPRVVAPTSGAGRISVPR